MTRRELRETIHTAGRHRPLILEISGGVAYVRPKGLHASTARVPLSVGAAWSRAMRAAVESTRAARRRKRP